MHDGPTVGGFVHACNRCLAERVGGEECIALNIPSVPVEGFVFEHFVAAQSGAGGHQFTIGSLIDD